MNVRVLSEGTTKEVLINPDQFGESPVWAEVFGEARELYPEYEARIHRPGDLHDGEDHPTMYNGKFHPQELEAVVLEVSKADASDFYDQWKIDHPLPEGGNVVRHAQAMKRALRDHAKAVAAIQCSEVAVADRVSVALRRVVVDIEKATKEVAA